MKTSIKNRKKQFLALCLSVLMMSSFSAIAACKDNSTDSSSSSSSSSTTNTEKDESLVLNGDFETFNTNDGKNVIGTSATGWTRAVNSTTSGSALSSKAASGIIDTSDDSWKQMTTSNADVSKFTVDQAKSKWDTLTTKDKLDYYEVWKADSKNKDKTISKELSFYESFNVDSEDLPTCENPGTHDGDAEDTNILMIHNQYPETDSTSTYKNLGTAQKYTSSSTVTVKAGTAAEFSVWVKTSELQSASTSGAPQDVIGKGAYISVTHSVGSKTLDAFQVKNINTEGVTENNGWVQYSFYLKGASYTDTTFTIVLGLGQGGGTDRLEYVNGYAFFDDIECNIITHDDFNTKTEGLSIVGLEDTKATKTVDASVSSDSKFAMDFYSQFSAIDFLDSIGDIAPTTETSNKKVYTAANGVDGTEVYTGLGINTDNDVVKVFNNAEEMLSTGNKYLESAYNKYFKEVEFLNGEKLLMLLSANGAAYTANSSMNFTVPADEYLAISFYVKTSDMNGFTGAGITLNDGNNKTSISSIDTTTIAAVEIGDNEDYYEGWQHCLFFVENTTDSEKSFNLTFNYGSTTVVGTTMSQYYAGFAAFAGFESHEMSKIEFEGATSGTYAKIVSLAGENTEAAGDSGFDSVASVPSNAIETGFANAKNYKGVYSNSAYVSDNTDTSINTNKNAGLLNKEYANEYASILNKLGGGDWEAVFGKAATQPLVIYNEETAEHAYGFIGKSTTIASNSYKTISLRVKVSAGAVANVYLIDMDDDTHASNLSIGSKITYWYDDDGNVCAEDPTDEHFNSKKDVAFKLQANGLYKVNKNWAGAGSVDANAYFANLANYEKDAEGNLIVAEGGASYDYNGKWDGEGLNGIAFYAKDGKYYADDEYKTEVFDFATAGLAPRYEAEENRDLCFEVSETGEDWATVTFYVHTGDTAKNYRLEVWSGSRDGAKINEAGSYVFFDANSPTDVDATSFTNLVTERKDEVSEENYFESVFSFFDSAKYLRYNELIDDNKVGYAYESYVPSSQVEGVAYLKYEGSNIYVLYADYELSEVTVTPDTADDDTTEDTEDDHDHDGETNIWLLTSSIAVAAALLVAIVAVVARKIIAAVRKKNGYVPSIKVKKEKKDKKSKE